jgi:hypothetical protein
MWCGFRRLQEDVFRKSGKSLFSQCIFDIPKIVFLDLALFWLLFHASEIPALAAANCAHIRVWRRRLLSRLRVLTSEIDNARHDLLAEAGSVENTIVTDIGLDVMQTHLVGNARADDLGGFRLSDA